MGNALVIAILCDIIGGMTPGEFKALVDVTHLSPSLQALWHDARGDWDRAHELAQVDAAGGGNWVHAYLHRKEGDRANARYWYGLAGRSMPESTLDEEWADLVSTLLRD